MSVADIPVQRAAELVTPALPSDSKLEIFPDVVQGSDDWHDQRRGMVTASAIGSLVSARSMNSTEYPCPECEAPAGSSCMSKAKGGKASGAAIKTHHAERTALAASLRDESPRVIQVAKGEEVRSLTALLAAERITGHTDPTFVSDDMLRGHEEEPLAVDAYSKHRGVPVETDGFMVRRWGGGKYKLGYSPDGLVGFDGAIEVKSRRQKKHLITVVSGEVPAENMAQLQAALFVSGREWIDYLSFSAGMHLWPERVEPDPRWFEAITAAIESFEAAAEKMIAAYMKAVEGLPLTERPDSEMWI